MAGSKISELTELAEGPAANDYFAVVDTSAGATKKIAGSRLGQAAIGGSVLGMPGVVMTGELTAQTPSTSTIYYQPIVVGSAITVSQMGVYVSGTPTSPSAVRLSIYQATSGWVPGSLVVDAGELSLGTSPNTALNITGMSTVLTPGLYLARMHTNATTQPAYYTFRGSPLTGSNLGTSTQLYLYKSGALTYGAAESTGTDASFTSTTTTGGFIYWLRMRWS